MLIRSQDKTALVKFENIVVNPKLPDSLSVICWSWQDAQRSGGYFILGKYSTKEKSHESAGYDSGSICGRRVNSNDSAKYREDVRRSASIKRK